MPRSTDLYIPDEPRIVCPNDPSYELPISIVDKNALTQNDEELIQAMAQHRPKTRFRAGDFGYLREIPFHLKRRHHALPQIWKVRFVITAWAYELMSVTMAHGGNIGMDRAIALLDRSGYDASQNRKPMIYAHGAPHGNYPNTAAWLPERALRRLMYNDRNIGWQHIIEEAGAQYYGYDAEKIPTSFAFSLAPDDYSHGSSIGKPFLHEEDVTHRMCLGGLEEHLFIPLLVQGQKRAALDPNHSVFAP